MKDSQNLITDEEINILNGLFDLENKIESDEDLIALGDIFFEEDG
jgi:hypothetical protein